MKVFCLIICGISGSTLVRKLAEGSQSQKVGVENSSEQNIIAESNEKEKKLMEESRKEAEEVPIEEEDKSFLDAIGSAVNDFTENLSGKEKGAKINSKISSVTSGDTYIESKTVLLGKEGWLF